LSTHVQSWYYVFFEEIIKAKDVRVSICTSILSKNHHLNTQNRLKETKYLAFKELLPKEELVPLIKGENHRDRVYTPEVTLWAFLSQAIEADKSQQAAVSRVVATAIANGEPVPSVNTSGFSQARSNLEETSISLLAKNTAQHVVEHLPKEWLWKQKQIKLVDGSTVSMPDTPSNQEMYPQSKCQKAGVGFPIARIVALIDYATGVLLDLALGPCQGKETGEHALLRQLLPTLTSNDLLLGDRYYSSFFLMATLIRRGISGVFPLHHTRQPDFKTGTIRKKRPYCCLEETGKNPQLDDEGRI
jgi:Transposase DDE domain